MGGQSGWGRLLAAFGQTALAQTPGQCLAESCPPGPSMPGCVPEDTSPCACPGPWFSGEHTTMLFIHRRVPTASLSAGSGVLDRRGHGLFSGWCLSSRGPGRCLGAASEAAWPRPPTRSPEAPAPKGVLSFTGVDPRGPELGAPAAASSSGPAPALPQNPKPLSSA